MTGQILAFIAILFLLLLLMSLKRRRSMENILRTTFSHYHYNESNEQLSLFTNHQTSADRHFALATISDYQIILNNNTIFSYARTSNQYFSQHLVEHLTQQLIRESRHKMVAQRIRKVYLEITVTEKKKYTICLYLRKGNQRYTKKHFSQVQDDIISWCWLIANSATDKMADLSAKKIILENDNAVAKDLARLAELEEKSTQKHSDSYLIDQLDKVIRLKQQGHLTEEEFNLAKAKLLNELNSD